MLLIKKVSACETVSAWMSLFKQHQTQRCCLNSVNLFVWMLDKLGNIYSVKEEDDKGEEEDEEELKTLKVVANWQQTSLSLPSRPVSSWPNRWRWNCFDCHFPKLAATNQVPVFIVSSFQNMVDLCDSWARGLLIE